MKANELMIGDLITFKDCQYDDEIVVIKIYQINQESNALVFIDDDKTLDEVTIDEELVGIPLTSEILEKNGFGYIKDDVYSTDHITHFYLGEPQFCKNMNLHIGTDNKGNFWINTRINTIYGIKYVHEFQNALRICKIEENIKL